MTLRGTFGIGSGETLTSVTSESGTVTAGTAAGDLIFVEASTSSSGTLSIAGGGSVTWSRLSGPDITSNNLYRTYLWGAVAAADSAGATVTVTSSSGGRMAGIGRVEYNVSNSGILVGTPTIQETEATSLTMPTASPPTSGTHTLVGLAIVRGRDATTAPAVVAGGTATVDGTSGTAYSSTPVFTALTVSKPGPISSGAQTPGTVNFDVRVRAIMYTLALAPSLRQVTLADTAGAVDLADNVETMPRVAGPDLAGAVDAGAGLLTKGLGPDPAAAVDATALVQSMGRVQADTARADDMVQIAAIRPDIQDYQFVIDAEPWTPFGLGQTICVATFEPGGAETRHQDTLSPVADVRYFGADRRTPPTWSFDLFTDVETPEAALGWASNFEAVWDQEATRSTPGAVLALRYKVAGRTRRVYGRPRNFTMVPSYLRTGRVHLLGDFELADNTYYDDTEQSVEVRARGSAIRSGFTFPVSFPMASIVNPEPRTELVRVGGTRPTWVDLTFHGPVIDPWVQIGTYRWGLRGTIATGSSVLVSGVPWRQGVLRNDGSWVPGMLDARARLSQLRLPPGQYSAIFGGGALSTNARAVVAWRDAYGAM